MKRTSNASLIVCIIMDLLGYATYAIPGFGEIGDIIWAPISAVVFYRMFGGWKGAFGGVFNFVEEILPGMDFIPSFTLMWLWMYFRNTKQAENKREYLPVNNYQVYKR